jgi:hypothetical protein
MDWIMRWLTRTLLWLGGAFLALIVALIAQEVAIYATSTETSAQEDARQAFLEECARRSMKPEDFEGPSRIKSPDRTYGSFGRIRPAAIRL